jgi:WD40 repeat protein
MYTEISMAIMLFRTNILALVGSDSNVEQKSNKLLIWDDSKKAISSEMKFGHKILNVKLRKDKIIVVFHDKISVFELLTFKNIDSIETSDNERGIVAVSYEQKQTVLAYPDKKKGVVGIKNYENSNIFQIKAHENNLAFITLSYEGKFLATASEIGTLIRIFNVENGETVQELRRGKEKANIKYICFEPNLKYIAASSDRGTIHIWSLPEIIKKKKNNDYISNNKIENKRSGFSWLPSFIVGEYFQSEWSFAQIRITDHNSIFCFGPENTMAVVSTEGIYYKAQFDTEKGGDCTIVQEEDLFVD